VDDVRSLLAAAVRQLGHDEARIDAELLLARVLDRPRAWLYAHADEVPDADRRAAFRRLVEARSAGQPVAYLTGRRGFRAFDLAVTADVLIPRPETELLVELALERLGERGAVADLGTGSGAIALAIARERPSLRVVATDASEAALAIARTNAQRVGLANVRFAHGDWCAALGAERFDAIVSNPPYIAADDPHLGQGDLRFEPRAALAAGADGLDAIRAIILSAPSHLVDGGWLLLEHGAEQGSAVRGLLEGQGFVSVRTMRDLAGHERATLARLRNAEPAEPPTR
jgi:release factor glutamine methyltransferase